MKISNNELKKIGSEVRVAYIEARHRHEMLVQKLARYSELKALKENHERCVKQRDDG